MAAMPRKVNRLLMLTVIIRVIQNPLDEHQGRHVKEQHEKKEQLWQEFQEKAVVLLEISKTKEKSHIVIL